MPEYGSGRPPEMPTPQEIAERKKQELSEWIEQNQDFLPHHIADQLTAMLDRFQFTPKNVMGFLEKGFETLRSAEYPPELLQLDSSQLPTHDNENKNFSPICTIAAVIPGVSLFPLRSLQATQRSAASQKIRQMDPTNRQELVRKGLLQINTGLGNAKDAKTFYGFPFAKDILKITEIIARISNSPLKREIFERIATTRLNRLAQRLDNAVKRKAKSDQKEKAFSRTGKDLRDTARPKNISFLIDTVSSQAQTWLAERTQLAEITPIKTDGKLTETLLQDPFWFAYASSDEEVSSHCRQIEKELREFVQNYLAWAPTGSVSGLRQELSSSPIQQEFLQAYIGKSFEQILNEEMQSTIGKQINEAKNITRDFLFKKTGYAQEIISFIDDLSETLEKILTKKQADILDSAQKKKDESSKQAEHHQNQTDIEGDVFTTIAEEEARGKILDFSKYKQGREGLTNTSDKEPVNTEKQTPLYSIARLIELNQMLTRSLSKSEMMPVFMEFHQLGSHYIKEFFKPENRTGIKMSDLYTFSNRSKLHKLYRLFSRLSDEKDAGRWIADLVTQELEKLSDSEFVALYTQFHDDSGGGPVDKIILSETFTPHGHTGQTYPNRYPNIRQRLLQLYRENPSLFNDSPKLAQTIKQYFKKTT